VILDSLSAHKGDTIRCRARKKQAEPCFTPTYASRANPIEAHFGPLRQFTVANPNHPAQTHALHAYLRQRNKNARHPAAQRREHARIRIRIKKRHPLERASPTHRGLTTQPGEPSRSQHKPRAGT